MLQEIADSLHCWKPGLPDSASYNGHADQAAMVSRVTAPSGHLQEAPCGEGQFLSPRRSGGMGWPDAVMVSLLHGPSDHGFTAATFQGSMEGEAHTLLS